MIQTEHMSFFKYTFDDVVDWHMKHQYYAEMSSASIVVSMKEARIAYMYDIITFVQVPLGVLLKNENKGDDIVDIVTLLHQYVPVIVNTIRFEVPGFGEEVEVKKSKMRKILFGGDQLTAVRARSAVRAKMNSTSAASPLQGIIPCAEDWHVKLNFLDVRSMCIATRI